MRWHSEAGPCCHIKKLPKKGASMSSEEKLALDIEKKKNLAMRPRHLTK